MYRRDCEQTTTPEPHTGFKANVALAAVTGHRTITQLAEHFDVHLNQVTTWEAQLESAASRNFLAAVMVPAEAAVDVKTLHAKIGELKLENDLLEGGFTKARLLSANR